jgi:hypothetical protein
MTSPVNIASSYGAYDTWAHIENPQNGLLNNWAGSTCISVFHFVVPPTHGRCVSFHVQLLVASMRCCVIQVQPAVLVVCAMVRQLHVQINWTRLFVFQPHANCALTLGAGVTHVQAGLFVCADLNLGRVALAGEPAGDEETGSSFSRTRARAVAAARLSGGLARGGRLCRG